MTLFVGIPFIIALFFLIMSFRNIAFHDVSLSLRYCVLIMTLVPIWGIILCVGIIYKFFTDLKEGKILMRNNKVNRLLYNKKNLL